MKNSKGMQLGALLAAMLLVGMAFVPVVGAQKDAKMKKDIHNAEEMDRLVQEIAKYKEQGKNISSLLDEYNVTQETYTEKVFKLQKSAEGYMEQVESDMPTQGGNVTIQSGNYGDISVYIHQVSVGSGWATVDADWAWSSVEIWGYRGTDDIVDLDWYPYDYVLSSRCLSGGYWGGLQMGVVQAYTPDATTSGWMVIGLLRKSPDKIGNWTQVNMNYHHTYAPVFQSMNLGLNAGNQNTQGSVSITVNPGGVWPKSATQNFQIR